MSLKMRYNPNKLLLSQQNLDMVLTQKVLELEKKLADIGKELEIVKLLRRVGGAGKLSPLKEDLDISTHNIVGSGDPNFIGFQDTSKRMFFGGHDGTTVRGAWFELFGNDTTLGGSYKGCAEFGLDATNLAGPWFRIVRYKDGTGETICQIHGTYTTHAKMELHTTNQSYYLQVEDSAFNGFGIYQGAPATAGWVVKWFTDKKMQPQGDVAMLDQKMMTFGTYTDAQRPAAGTAGRWIFNTDDGMPNYDDGTNWRDINNNIT